MKISRLLLEWYARNGRELPWRETKDPYKIWISEIILQQTRIAQGMDYYFRFLEKFPDIESLAAANEKEVMKAWEGLGYYSRARNLHETAKNVVENNNGVFPDNYKDILNLKGIGPYTAGAISSICFNLPEMAVDGNVKRVAARFFGLDNNIKNSGSDKFIKDSLKEIFDKKNPGSFNQAIMDLGSMICTPTRPACEECPLSSQCVALKTDRISELPVSYSKTKIRNRYLNYFIISSKNELLIRKRETNDIWKSLYEFVLIETPGPHHEKELIPLIEKQFEASQNFIVTLISPGIKHILSHQRIFTRFIHIETEIFPQKLLKGGYEICKKEELGDFPFPRLLEKYLQSNPL